MGLISSLFGGKDNDNNRPPIQPRPDISYQSGSALKSWADDYIQRYPYDPARPYSGDMTAKRTATQEKGQNILSDYLDTPVHNDSFKAARSSAISTLDGSYDPRTSPYYKAMKDQIMRDQQEASDAVMHRQAARGMLHSDPTQIQLRKLAENTSGQIANLLGSLYESERDRQMQVIPYATAIGQFEESIPVNRARAAETIGGAPMQHEQGNLDRLYNEYLRQLEGAREPLNIYEGLTGRAFSDYQAQPFYPASSSSSTAGNIGSIVSELLPYAMMYF